MDGTSISKQAITYKVYSSKIEGAINEAGTG
jgi:hypothetical protein